MTADVSRSDPLTAIIVSPARQASATVQGAVFQRIDQNKSLLDNIVQLESNAPDWLPFQLPNISTRVCLRHTFQVTPPANITIVYDSTSAQFFTANRCAARPNC
jgi:hypothetical protein